MKIIYLAPVALCGLLMAQGNQMTVSGGVHVTADTVYWGSDSSRTIVSVGGTLKKDSANTGTLIAIAGDTCSQPYAIEKWGRRPNWKNELTYSIYATAVDSSQFKFRIQTRYCSDVARSSTCEPWVPAGLTAGDSLVTIVDSIVTPQAKATGTTRMRNLYFVLGSQARACAVKHITGAAAGDTTKFSNVISRTQ